MMGGLALGYIVSVILDVSQPFYFVILYFIVATAGVLLFRFIFKRTFLDLTQSGRAESCERVLIVGAGKAGQMILAEIQNAEYDPKSPVRNLLPVCFVDDDVTKLNSKINGVSVAGVCKDIPKICIDKKIDSIRFNNLYAFKCHSLWC